MTDQPRKPVRRRSSRGRLAAGGAVLLALLATGATVVYLGDDGETDPPAGIDIATVEQAALEYTECVRDQGIRDYPEPEVESDGSVMFENLSELESSQADIEAAQEACHHILEAVMPTDGEGERNVIDPPDPGWEAVGAGGDCQCADGSDYNFYAREADPRKVVLFLDGGGVCWSAETCSPDSENRYRSAVDGPSGEGLFDFSNERNPFADHSFVFAPYCTADLHLGNTTTEYESGLTIRHKGYVNATAALDHLTASYPDATEIVVVGASAGSASAPLYAALASDALPDADVTVIADSSGSYPDTPEVNEPITASWGIGDAVSELYDTADPTAEGWSLPGLFAQSGLQHPDIVFARHDYAYDEEQATRLEIAGVPADDLLALIDANEDVIENARIDLSTYVAPGTDHLGLVGERFYTETVDGRPLVDWVADLVRGDPVEDVHCDDCSG